MIGNSSSHINKCLEYSWGFSFQLIELTKQFLIGARGSGGYEPDQPQLFQEDTPEENPIGGGFLGRVGPCLF